MRIEMFACAAFVSLGASFVADSSAATINVPSAQSVASNGLTTGDGFIVGRLAATEQSRSASRFNLASVSIPAGEVLKSADIVVSSPSSLFSATNPGTIAVRQGTVAGGFSTWASGDLYGSTTVSSFGPLSSVVWALNSAAISAITSQIGVGSFEVSYSLLNVESVIPFAALVANPFTGISLRLTTEAAPQIIPLPAAVLMAAPLLIGFIAARRR